jgi:GAF domain-containing protein
MTALSVVSRDLGYISRMKETFPGLDVDVHPELPVQVKRKNEQFFLIDTEEMSDEALCAALRRLKRKKIPFILAASETIPAPRLLAWTQQGALTIFFKNQDSLEIRREWRRLRQHYRALQELKEVVINEPRFADFIEMIGGLTTDNDISRNMNHLLDTLRKTFVFDSVALYITVEKTLKKKVELGNNQSTLYPDSLDNRQTSKIRAFRHPIQKGPARKQPAGQFPFPVNCWFVPLFTGNRFIGLIVAHPQHDGNANTADRMLIEAFARQASLALENARLYRDVLKAQDRLVSEEKKALLGQMAISLNHEINNPLSIISMEAQLLQKRMSGQEEQMNHRLVSIENNIERIRQILEKISSLELEAADVVDYLKGHQMINLRHGN